MTLRLPRDPIKSLQTATLIQQSYKWIKTEKKKILPCLCFLPLPFFFVCKNQLKYNTNLPTCQKFLIWFLHVYKYVYSFRTIFSLTLPWNSIYFVVCLFSSLMKITILKKIKRILFFVIYSNKSNVRRYFFSFSTYLDYFFINRKKQKFLFFFSIKRNHAYLLYKKKSLGKFQCHRSVLQKVLMIKMELRCILTV